MKKTAKMLFCQIGNATHVAALVVLHLNWYLPKEEEQTPLYKHANDVHRSGEEKRKGKTEYKDGKERLNQLTRKATKAQKI